MPATAPVSEESIATNDVATVTTWAEAVNRLAEARGFWLATVRPDGRPHVMPVFAVWLDGSLYTTSGDAARKARNLRTNSQCVLTVSADGMDLVVEADAVKVHDAGVLQRVAELYEAKYDWILTVRDGAYTADYGAPSAGAPPYELYQLSPRTAFGLATAEPFGATRWRF